MIGAGASGFQIVPTIAPEVASLVVFQRSAQWMFPNPNYHAKVGPGVQLGAAPPAVLRALVPIPAVLARLRRRARGARVDPEWKKEGSVSAANEAAREIFTQWITSQVNGDPELVEKVVPRYPATGKRTLQDNGSWLRRSRATTSSSCAAASRGSRRTP